MDSKHLLIASALLSAPGCSWGQGDVDPCDESSGAGGVCCTQDECSSYGDGLSAAEYDELVANCNFVTIREQNLIDGNPPYETTQACRDTLIPLLKLGPNLAGNVNMRKMVLDSLHYLFFHPLAAPADGILFEDEHFGTGVTAILPELLDEQIGNLPPNLDIPMTQSTANTAIIHYWFDNISDLGFENLFLEVDAATAAYRDGGIVVYNQFASYHGEPRGGAAVLYHELAHVRTPWHIDCTMAYENFPELPYYTEEHCDGDPARGAYPNGGALTWALAMGGLAAHPAGVPERVLDINNRYIAGTAYTPGAAYHACQSMIGRTIHQFRTLAQYDVYTKNFCLEVDRNARDTWEEALPAGAYGVLEGTAPSETMSCESISAQGSFSLISIVGNTVTIPQSAVNESLADLDATLAGSWTEPVTVYDATGASVESAEIQNLRPTSILAHIGLQAGDRITHVDGISVGDIDALLRNFPDPEQVAQVEITLLRDTVVTTLLLQVDPAL